MSNILDNHEYCILSRVVNGSPVLEGRTEPETAAPVNRNRTIIQCLHITPPVYNHGV